MKTHRTIKTWTRVLLLVALAVAATPAAEARSVKMDVQMAEPMVLTGARQKAYLRIALSGVELERGRRAPVNVAIVLDRSGSMEGRKLEEAKRAAIMAIGQLRDDDVISVVTYESTVDVLVPATKLYNREAIRNAIRGITSAGKTALFAGVSKGSRELRKFLDRNRVNTLLLLSDGLAKNQSQNNLVNLGSCGEGACSSTPRETCLGAA